jgi:eukaryotic-like serine/threonine-protein kinase
MFFIRISAGEFLVGSDDGGDDEKPIHTVYLDAYCMDETEVTNRMYARCVSAVECDRPGGGYYGNFSYVRYPVGYVELE